MNFLWLLNADFWIQIVPNMMFSRLLLCGPEFVGEGWDGVGT